MKQQLKETSISNDSLENRDFVLNTTISEQQEVIEGICLLGSSIHCSSATNEEKEEMKSFLQKVDTVAQKNWVQILNQPEAINNYNALKDIAKQVHFWFSNEANYPEGTNGYRITKQIESIIPELKQL